MKDNVRKELQNEWIKNVIATNTCIDELNKLNSEKEELLKLAESENPPENILELLKKSEESFEKLLKTSEKIKQNAKIIKEKIEKLEEN